MRFIAQEVREIMAQLGFRTLNEMVGRTDALEARHAVDHWKAKGIDLSKLLYSPKAGPEVGRFCTEKQDHGLEKGLDLSVLLAACQPAIDKGQKVRYEGEIKNTHRVVGTILGNEITKKHIDGLPDGTIHLKFKGSAGQSLGAFVPAGVTIELEGDANDYVGKGLSGGKIIVHPPAGSTFVPEENILIGNVALYGATAGEAYIRGMAGERFGVRNSGVNAVVEAVGDHGCEYMTGGRVVVLGPAGRNFGAGMSGGLAYVLDKAGDFAKRVNPQMVDVARLEDLDEIIEVRQMIERHVQYTGSELGKRVLANWNANVPKFVKIAPRDYTRMVNAIKRVTDSGLSGEEAVMVAFEENARDLSRVGGN
jgi:glutamate synthase (ferredoxin)